jgi:hypothetical protein
VRDHDVTTLTTAELEHSGVSRASLALARPGSPVRASILTRIGAHRRRDGRTQDPGPPSRGARA